MKNLESQIDQVDETIINHKEIEYFYKNKIESLKETNENKELLNEFFDTLNKNSPIPQWSKHFYPYKPLIVIAILSTINKNDFLNKEINIKDEKIIKGYYELLTSNIDFSDYLNKLKGKEQWATMINDEFYGSKKLFQEIINHLFKLPLNFLNCSFFDTKSLGSYKVIFKMNSNKQNEIYNLILEISKMILYKCIPEYKKDTIDFNNLQNIQMNTLKNIANDEKISKYKSRKYQNYWSRKIKERDQKCVICGLSIPQLLEAAHIKDFTHCNNQEKYDLNNGITLCCNHHRAFDRGLFKFDDQKIIISQNANKYSINEIQELIKKYEKQIDFNSIPKQYLEFSKKDFLKK